MVHTDNDARTQLSIHSNLPIDEPRRGENVGRPGKRSEGKRDGFRDPVVSLSWCFARSLSSQGRDLILTRDGLVTMRAITDRLFRVKAWRATSRLLSAASRSGDCYLRYSHRFSASGGFRERVDSTTKKRGESTPSK